ncbi:hypothetical protein EI94DRAFT_1782005 [Lactarius quietus]|nr:hypothetical protein EI94DRAFT_1782005 [Lactarius quietus]
MARQRKILDPAKVEAAKRELGTRVNVNCIVRGEMRRGAGGTEREMRKNRSRHGYRIHVILTRGLQATCIQGLVEIARGRGRKYPYGTLSQKRKGPQKRKAEHDRNKWRKRTNTSNGITTGNPRVTGGLPVPVATGTDLAGYPRCAAGMFPLSRNDKISRAIFPVTCSSVEARLGTKAPTTSNFRTPLKWRRSLSHFVESIFRGVAQRERHLRPVRIKRLHSREELENCWPTSAAGQSPKRKKVERGGNRDEVLDIVAVAPEVDFSESGEDSAGFRRVEDKPPAKILGFGTSSS